MRRRNGFAAYIIGVHAEGAVFLSLDLRRRVRAGTLTVTEGEVAHLLVPKGLGEMSCRVQPMPPSLDFGFRFRAHSYIVRRAAESVPWQRALVDHRGASRLPKRAA